MVYTKIIQRFKNPYYPIKWLLLGMKCVFKHLDFSMFVSI